jgi:flagellar assembly factor FliW
MQRQFSKRTKYLHLSDIIIIILVFVSVCRHLLSQLPRYHNTNMLLSFILVSPFYIKPKRM